MDYRVRKLFQEFVSRFLSRTQHDASLPPSVLERRTIRIRPRLLKSVYFSSISPILTVGPWCCGLLEWLKWLTRDGLGPAVVERLRPRLDQFVRDVFHHCRVVSPTAELSPLYIRLRRYRTRGQSDHRRVIEASRLYQLRNDWHARLVNCDPWSEWIITQILSGTSADRQRIPPYTRGDVELPIRGFGRDHNWLPARAAGARL